MEGSTKFPAFDDETQIDHEATPASPESESAASPEATPLEPAESKTVTGLPAASTSLRSRTSKPASFNSRALSRKLARTASGLPPTGLT